jgi:predicted HicB family RNase H-like nuclease
MKLNWNIWVFLSLLFVVNAIQINNNPQKQAAGNAQIKKVEDFRKQFHKMKDNELQMMMQKMEKEFAERHKNKVHLSANAAANATGNGTNSTVNETLLKQKALEA